MNNEGYDDFDPEDSGLPGLPLAAAMVFAVVIFAPLWLPFAVAVSAVDQLWNKPRG
jgi:hypothetical protein